MTAQKVMRGFVVTAALCLSATLAQAQEYRVFVMGGDSILNDAKSFTENYIPYASRYARGGEVIGGVERSLYKIIGIEGSYALGPNNLEVTNLNYTTEPVTSYGVRYSRFSADVVGHVPGEWKGARVYAVLGLEYDLFSPTSAARAYATKYGFAFAPNNVPLSSQGKAGVNIGGGIDYRLFWKIDLRIDGREHFFSSPTYGLPQSSAIITGAFYPIGGPAHDLEYSMGFVYKFGKSK